MMKQSGVLRETTYRKKRKVDKKKEPKCHLTAAAALNGRFAVFDATCCCARTVRYAPHSVSKGMVQMKVCM